MTNKLKKIGLTVAIALLSLTTFAQTKSGQTLYTGYQYVVADDEYYDFKYSRKYSGSVDEFVTTYTIYHPTKGYAYITITAKHYRSMKKVVVSVDFANEGILSHINSEETTYETPSIDPFGFRGSFGVIGGKRVPNQLLVKFASNKFENVKVAHINATSPGTDDIIFYVLDEK